MIANGMTETVARMMIDDTHVVRGRDKRNREVNVTPVHMRQKSQKLQVLR